MSIKIIDTLESLGNFPVVNSNDVNCSGTRLDVVISATASELNSKPSKKYVDDNFAKKSEIGTYIKPSSGIPKSDLSNDVKNSLDLADTAIQSHQDISGKADKTYVDNAINNKADASSVDIMSSKIETIETNQESLSARMDNFASLEDGSTTGDAELTDIRVGFDGITYSDAGTSVRTQVSSVNNRINTIKASSYVDNFTDGTFNAENGKIVYNDNAYKSIFFKCDKNTRYIITNKYGNQSHFDVFFTNSNPLTENPNAYDNTLLRNENQIIVNSSDYEYLAIWYWFSGDGDASYIKSGVSVKNESLSEQIDELRLVDKKIESKIVDIEDKISMESLSKIAKRFCYSENGYLAFYDNVVYSTFFKCEKNTDYAALKGKGISEAFDLFFINVNDLSEISSATSTYHNTKIYENGKIVANSGNNTYGVVYYWHSNDIHNSESDVYNSLYIFPADIGYEVVDLKNKVSEIDTKITKFDCSGYGLPILSLTGSTDGMSKDVKKTLTYSYGFRTGSCTLKWQGSSSIAYPKKNYTITFDKSFEAIDGWGEQNKYCLKANWIDFSHARNVVSAKIWGQLVKSRPDNGITDNILTESGLEIATESGDAIGTYYDRLKGKINGGAVDGFPICLVINGDYMGIYTFNIPKDKWMLGMGSGEKEAIVSAETGADLKKEAILDGSDYDIEFATGDDDSWVKTSLNTMINKCINCQSVSDYNNLKEYVDIDSWIDYYIHVCLIQAEDCIFRNYLLCTYDGKKWFVTAYDMDQTFGLGDNGLKFYSVKLPSATTFDRYLHNNRIAYLIYQYDLSKLKSRYTELRKTVFSESNIHDLFVDFMKDIPMPLKNEEVNLWNSLPSTDINNFSQIMDFYRLRCNFIDDQVTGK